MPNHLTLASKAIMLFLLFAACIYTPIAFAGDIAIVVHIDNKNAQITQSEGGSLLIGYKMGQFTPYAIAAYGRATSEVKPSGVPNLTPQLIQFNSFYEQVLTSPRIEQDSLSLGLRYDIAENYALKFQVDKINAQRSPLTISTRAQDTDKVLTLFTIALDFLF